MRGARITIVCDCGHVYYAEYGETWACPDCGRRWNTGQIPEAEYWGIMHEMRRYRLQVILATLVVGAGSAIALILLGRRFFPLALMVMTFWFLIYMPRWRQKLRRRARSLPRWQLTPE